jgi:uncharacterized membrane protein YgcG
MLADLEALDWPPDLDKETSAKLYEACAAEWKADMQSGFVRNVREASEPVEAESLPASRSLQSVSATLTTEEARWRSGGAALQQHWLQEAQSMFMRWRAEDSARLTAALQQAASATVSFEARLAALPPAPRLGWAALCAALRVEAAGPGAVLEAVRHEFGVRVAVVEGEQPLLRVLQALHAAGAAEALPGGAGEIYAALRLTTLREGAAGGATGGAGPTARQLCFSSTSEGGIGGDEEGAPPVAAAVCLLLLLASGAAPPPPPPPPPPPLGDGDAAPAAPPLGRAALQRQTALQRLDALLPWLLPSMGPATTYGGGAGSGGAGSGAGGGAGGGGSAGSSGAGDAPALTLAQQRALFSALYSVAAAATAAARQLAGARRAPPEHAAAAPAAAECATAECAAAGGAAAATPCAAALRLALQQRPQTWALTPPSARDFLIWCAACDPVIGGALAGACEGEEQGLGE